MKVKRGLEFEHAYCHIAVQRFNHYTTWTPAETICYTRKNNDIEKQEIQLDKKKKEWIIVKSKNRRFK